MKISPATERKTYKFMFMNIFCYFIFKVDYKHIYVRRIYLKMTYGCSFPLYKLGLGKPQNIREILCRDVILNTAMTSSFMKRRGTYFDI